MQRLSAFVDGLALLQRASDGEHAPVQAARLVQAGRDPFRRRKVAEVSIVPPGPAFRHRRPCGGSDPSRL